MPFIEEILKYDSLSIVGLEKNVGKTECLNYILYRLPLHEKRVAVTSIGIDGENKDQVTSTKKPEIFLREGMYFSTAEAHYKERRLVSELVEITNERSSLGRILTAKVSVGGKALISGPSSGVSLRRWVAGMEKFGIDLTIIDGAISRLSSASPAISKAMVLATGAAFSSIESKKITSNELETRLKNFKKAKFTSGATLPALFESKKDLEKFNERHNKYKVKRKDLKTYKGDAFIGIDAGSTTTKLVLIDNEGALLSSNRRKERKKSLRQPHKRPT